VEPKLDVGVGRTDVLEVLRLEPELEPGTIGCGCPEAGRDVGAVALGRDDPDGRSCDDDVDGQIAVGREGPSRHPIRVDLVDRQADRAPVVVRLASHVRPKSHRDGP